MSIELTLLFWYNVYMKKFTCFVITLLLLLTLFACGEKPSYIDYKTDNSYSVEIIDNDDALIFKPSTNDEIKYGIIFIVGTAIDPVNYTYLGNTLAKQGYIYIIPKITGYMAYIFYDEDLDNEEKDTYRTKVLVDRLISNYSNITFFVSGHSQGGGAAVRYAKENKDTIKGAILYSPLCFENDTLADTNMPTLFLEADNDHVLTDAMKIDSKTRLPENAIMKKLENASHMSFSSMDSDDILSMFLNDGDGMSEEDKQKQKEETIKLTLDFLKNNI